MTRLPYTKVHWWPLPSNQDLCEGSECERSFLLKSWSGGRAVPANPASRVQRRLWHPIKRDRIFLRLIHRKRHQPSRLNQRLTRDQSRRRLWRQLVVAAALGLSLGGIAWTSLFIEEQVTLGGVPYRIVRKFWQDRPAREAYFSGDRQGLHDRLVALEVEKDIKQYYRERLDFRDENDLDLYIHQIMYDRTGYVGEAYEIDEYGRLRARQYASTANL